MAQNTSLLLTGLYTPVVAGIHVRLLLEGTVTVHTVIMRRAWCGTIQELVSRIFSVATCQCGLWTSCGRVAKADLNWCFKDGGHAATLFAVIQQDAVVCLEFRDDEVCGMLSSCQWSVGDEYTQALRTRSISAACMCTSMLLLAYE